MPYFFASAVEARISSGVIFFSILSRIACEPLLHAQRQPLAAGEAHLLEQLVGEEVDAGIAAPEEAHLALAHLLAELEDALLLRGEGVVLDLDHLHGKARAHLLHRVEHVVERVGAEGRGPTSSRSRRTLHDHAQPREVIMMCVSKYSWGEARSSRLATLLRCGPSSTSPPSRYTLPAMPRVSSPFERRIDDLEERHVTLRRDTPCRHARSRGASSGPSGVACGPPTTTCAAGVATLDDLRDELHAAPVRGPAGHAPELGIELRDDLLDLGPGIRREVQDLDLMPRAKRLRAERKEAVGGLVEIRVEVPPAGTRAAAPRPRGSACSPPPRRSSRAAGRRGQSAWPDDAASRECALRGRREVPVHLDHPHLEHVAGERDAKRDAERALRPGRSGSRSPGSGIET